jgi:hypothetical protein
VRTPADQQRAQDDVFRAIGRYTVHFAFLVGEMRESMGRRITGPVQWVSDRRLFDLVVGSLTAQPMADAFFGICRATTSLDKDEQAIEKLLRRHVLDEIKRRNDFAHGDWLPTSWQPEGGPLSPSVYRIKPGSLDTPFSQLKLTIG